MKRIVSRERRGKWYVAFTWYHESGPRCGEIEHEKIPLKAVTKKDAITEAYAITSSHKNVKTSRGEMIVPEGYNVIYETK